MILIFDKNGKYFNEVKLLREASELTGANIGNIGQILTRNEGNMTANGFYFVNYDKKESEFEKQKYIDNVEKALEILIIAWTKTRLDDRIEKIIQTL